MKAKIDLLKGGLIVVFFGAATTSFAAERITWSFEKTEDMGKWSSQSEAKIEQSKEYATNGEYSAKVTFPPGGSPGIFIYPEEEDWSKYVYLSMDFHNPGKEAFGGPAIQLFDDKGENIIFHMNVVGGENLSYKKRLLYLFESNPKFNAKKVKKFTIFKGPEDIEKVLYLDNIRLESVSDTLFKFPEISDFETKEDLSKWGYISTLFEQSEDYNSQGDYGAKVTFSSKSGEWPGIYCYLENGGSSKDWSKYEKFVFDIFNPGQEVFNFGITFANYVQEDPRYKGKTLYYGVDGQQEKEVEFLISDIAKGIDIKDISYFSINIGRPEKDIIIYIDNFRLISKEE